MSKTPLLTTGLNGLVGSKFAADFAAQYQFDSLEISDPSNPVDITQLDQVQKAFAQSEAKAVIHLAAYTNVTGAWEQSGDKNGLAYKVNVDGTKNIIQACQKNNCHLIHISTAYVFDGDKQQPYLETDPTSPIEWYGQTKAWAEQAVQDSDLDWTMLRIDQPFRSDSFPKPDLVQRIITGIKENTLPPQFTNHYFGPTFIDDFAKVLDWAVRVKPIGLFHASSGEQWTDYNFATLVNQSLKLGGQIKKGDLEEYLKTISRPYQKNTALNCDKLKDEIDFKLTPIREAIDLIEKV